MSDALGAKLYTIPSVNHTDSLNELKLKIMQQIELSPSQQSLFLYNKELEGGNRSLESLGVTSNSQIHVHQNDEEEEEGSAVVNAICLISVWENFESVSAGFGMSKLLKGESFIETSSIPWDCLLCTFTNDGSHLSCSMCSNPRPLRYSSTIETKD